jgi:eukaryotic-like serine/threonine-protein kinase
MSNVSSPRALPDWSAVPSNSEDDRVLLNRRLAFFGRAMFLLSCAFLLAGDALNAVFNPDRMSLARDPGLVLDLVGTSVFGAQWLLCRRQRRSSVQLNLIDICGVVGGLATYCVAAAAMSRIAPSEAGYQLLVLIAVTLLFVVMRAVVIPGTTRRSALLSCAACAPLVLLAWYAMGQGNVGSSNRIRLTLYTGLWAVTIVASAALASRVIYGLQQRVRAATELGQYTLEQQIGQGGMGKVYRARHALLRRPTAIKLLLSEQPGDRHARRFEREVQLTSSLAHPNTIAIYDYGHTPDGTFYYAMEYLDGLTLEELIAHDGPQRPGRVCHLLRQVCGALSEAHGIGLVHRDIKPANIMLCLRGGIPDHVKVLDFGLVKESTPRDASDVTRAGALIGTPLYLAPEAISHPDRVDGRADLYAVGAVAYALLTGAPVFHGSTVLEICAAHMYKQPESPSLRRGEALPEALESLVLRCLAKDPAGRPTSAADMAALLDTLREVRPWTAADAQRWWTERASAVMALAQTQRHAVGSGPRTVAIDLDDRAA